MEALAKDQLSSDSEDEDYVPPEVKAPALSLRKRSGGLELESDDDDDDDDELSDDADLVDAEAVQLYGSQGAGPSSTGAGPSSAAGGPSSADAASASAAGSSAGAASSAMAGSSSATGASSVAAGSSSTHAGASRAVTGSSASPAGASIVADATVAGGISGAGESAKVASSVVDGIVATETEKTAEVGPGAGANVGKAGGEAAVVADANGASSAKAEEPATKKPRVEKPAGKQSIDDIWADMNAGVSRAKEPATTTDPSLAAWLAPPPTEKKAFKITRLGDLEKQAKREEPVQKKKGRTGLEGVLDVVRGKTDTVIKKTKEQWKEFKKDDEINEDLEKHKKDKNRYTDKVAFLQRSDVREWEYEQRGKRRR